MYNCSAAFHEAVKQNKKQKMMLIFNDIVFTEEDIDISVGLEFHDYFNLTESVSIGQALSNEISFTLWNRERLLNEYEFGDFLATLGVLIGQSGYNYTGTCTVTSGSNWGGNASYPYLTRNGSAVSSQPSFPIASLMSYNGKLYAFAEDGRYAVYNDSTGANITNENPVNGFMQHKAMGWKGKGIYYNRNTRILSIYEGGIREQYEFVPLGYFTADRPDVPDKIAINISCLDYMQKFEKDMPTSGELKISYPTTIGNLFARICSYAGVSYRSVDFINSNATIGGEPEEFRNATMRTVIGWIAEAAGSNARFDRDGYLIMDWIRSTSTTLDEHDWSEFDPYWYETKRVTKLYNRDTSETAETTYGNGNENYLIQDNPLMVGAS